MVVAARFFFFSLVNKYLTPLSIFCISICFALKNGDTTVFRKWHTTVTICSHFIDYFIPWSISHLDSVMLWCSLLWHSFRGRRNFFWLRIFSVVNVNGSLKLIFVYGMGKKMELQWFGNVTVLLCQTLFMLHSRK